MSNHEHLGQDNLHSGPYKPVSLGPSDITALLPCDEADFEAGRIPEKRAALDGTPPAIADPVYYHSGHGLCLLPYAGA